MWQDNGRTTEDTTFSFVLSGNTLRSGGSYSNRRLHIKHSIAKDLILHSSGKTWRLSSKDGEYKQMSKCQLSTPFTTQSMLSG